MKFIDGLKEEFCSAILLQCPNSLYIAFVLAQLQEEVYDPGKQKELKKPDFYIPKSNLKTTYPLPSPPLKSDKQQLDLENKKSTTTAEEKWQALRRFRRAKGLCEKCAAKWSRNHVCSDSVQLHVIQELLDVFDTSELTSHQGDDH